MNLDLIRQRILDKSTKIKRVGISADILTAISGPTIATADCWVVLLAETAGQNDLIGTVVSQQVTRRFAVVTAVKSAIDSQGGASADALEDTKRELRAALVGYQPPPDGQNSNYEPITLAGGRVIALRESTLFWAEEFLTRYTYRSIQ